MSRITPSNGTAGVDIGELEDYEPYKGYLRKIDFQTGAAEFGSEMRLVVDWSLTDDENDNDTIRDWISLKLGKQQSGQVSKLRALLNALHGRGEQDEIVWFDDETLEWAYSQGDKADDVLTTGREVVFRGKHGVKQDGSPKFTITTYQSAIKKAKRKPAPVEDDEDEPQPVRRGPKALANTKSLSDVAREQDEDDSEIPF